VGAVQEGMLEAKLPSRAPGAGSLSLVLMLGDPSVALAGSFRVMLEPHPTRGR
jgi:hypothetical protein